MLTIKDLLAAEPLFGRTMKLANGDALHFIVRAYSNWDGASIWDIYHNDGGTIYAIAPDHSDCDDDFVVAKFKDLTFETNFNIEDLVANMESVVAWMFGFEPEETIKFKLGTVEFKFGKITELFLK